MIICSQCGFICPENARNCGDCGAVMSSGGAAYPPANSQPAPTVPVQQYRGGYLPPPAPVGVGPSKSTNHLLWILPLGIVVILVTVIGLTITSKRAASSSISETNSGPPAPAATPYPSGRLVYCNFNGVHVRALPNLDAFIITDIQQGQAIRVFRESSNYDAVFIRSINQTVTDNWSEIQIENTSIRGWVFSGFLR